MAQPSTNDISRVRGDTYSIVFTIKDSAGVVVDLTGYTAFLFTVNVSAEPTDETDQVFQSTGSAPTPANGKVVFPIVAGDVDTIGEFFYDAQFTDPAGKIRTFSKGAFTLTQDVTKD